jgi:hypothetical protein
MNWFRHSIRGTYAALAISAVVGAGCYERPVVPHDALSASIPRGTVQMIVQQESSSGDELTFVVHLAANGIKVGAYQGELTFVPGALTLIGETTPQADGEFHLVNPAGFEHGSVKFAAYTTADAFSSTEAFRFRAKAEKPLAEAALTARLDVVGEPTGSAVAKNRVLASHGILDATNRILVP